MTKSPDTRRRHDIRVALGGERRHVILDRFVEAPAQATMEEDLAKLDQQRRVAATQRRLTETQEELGRYREIERLISQFSDANLHVPHWTVDGFRKGGKKAIATLQLSDTHFDEVIESTQILDFNQYDRSIAEARLEMLAQGTIKVARDYIAGVEYEGLAILATGDIFSGDIHEELRTTNEGTLFEGCVFWVPRMVAFLETLIDDFQQVNVTAVVGNHGRMTMKPVYKNRPQSNIEWLFWHWVADHFASKGETRITFQIANGLSALTTIYNTRYSLEHGDEFRGGDGQVGALGPVKRGQLRSATMHIAMDRPFDWMVVGHFHQYMPPSQRLIMGGSLKGFDEYAAGKHLTPERPQQGFWVTSPEHGPTISAPIFVD